MKRFAVLFAMLALAGCGAHQPIKPDIAAIPRSTQAVPMFSPSRFDCGARPIPPSMAVARSPHGGSAAARNHNALGTWGQHCANMLTTLGDQLKAAGQMTSSEKPDK